MSGSDAARLPRSVDIRLLGTCNLSCSFCFGPRHDVRPTRFKEVCEVIPVLREHGVSRLVFTGGEPLLVRRLPTMLEIASSFDFQVVLSTNGSLLARRHAGIASHLDWIALPLESVNVAVHNSLRPGRSNSFRDVRDGLLLVRDLYPGLKVKLGTVLQPGNLGSTAGIPALVTSWGVRPDVWKLYQVSFSSYAYENRSKLLMSEQVFEEQVLYARAAADSCGWRVVVYRNSQRDGQYLFMEPSGDAMVVCDGEEVVIGNFLDDLPEVVRNWRSYVNLTRLNCNANITYP